MASMEPRRHITGVVVSAGKMINTVKVRIPKQVWNKRVHKYYSEPQTVLVSDPTNSTREGDVVTLETGRRISRHIRHAISGVIAPMGVPMNERAPIPSAVERLAAVEAKRAAKDIRQAERGRWPAIVRIREREARQAMKVDGGELMDRSPAMTLGEFVTIYRKRKHDQGVAESLVPDFLRVAGYQVLQGEVPLDAQVAALAEAKRKLVKERAKLEERLNPGKPRAADEALTLSEREDLSKQKLELWQQIHRLERSITHFNSYIKEVNPKDQKRRQELKTDPLGWHGLVTILSMSHWEKNIAALDLWGSAMLREAAQTDIDDVLLRAGVAPAVLNEVDEAPIEPVVELRDEVPVEDMLKATQPEPAINIAEEKAFEAQYKQELPVSSDEMELPSTSEQLHTESLGDRIENTTSNAKSEVEEPLNNNGQVEEEGRASSDAPAEPEQKEEKKSGGFWSMFGKR